MAETAYGITLIALGVFCLSASVILLFLFKKDKSWWEDTIMGMLGMLGMPLPEYATLSAIMPIIQEVLQGIVKKIIFYVKLVVMAVMATLLFTGAVFVAAGFHVLS